MNSSEVIKKIANTLGLKLKAEKFFESILEDGETRVTNNMEDEGFEVGQTLYVVGESTLSPAPAGEHTTREGFVLTVDEESVIVKIELKEEVSVEEIEEVEEVGEVETKVMDEKTAMAKEIVELKSIMKDMVSLMDNMKLNFKTEINTLKSEFEKFKNTPERTPVESKQDFKRSFEDFRLDVLKEFRANN